MRECLSQERFSRLARLHARGDLRTWRTALVLGLVIILVGRVAAAYSAARNRALAAIFPARRFLPPYVAGKAVVRPTGPIDASSVRGVRCPPVK
jgi:hypothetical protein